MRMLVALAVLAVFPSQAQRVDRNPSLLWEPPRIDWPNAGVGGSVIHRLTINGFPIVLDRTPLEGVRQHVGGSIGSSGDAGDAEAWLCLHGSDATGPWIFWLTSDEINGRAVGGFIWRRVDPGQAPDSRCRPLPGRNPIELQPPLRLGMTKVETMRFLGAPTSIGGRSLFYEHEEQQRIDGADYTISNGLEVVIAGGVLTQIAAFEISSN